MIRPLVLGTRGSDLALWQARRMAARIRGELGRECRLEIVKTQGDQIQNVAFHKMEGKGFFTKELQLALVDGTVDLVVHSLKDLPTEEPEGLEVVAIPERTTTADLLLARTDLLEPSAANPLGLPPGSVVGTSSLRRAAQVLVLAPGVRVTALRGNVPTRVGKLQRGDYDAILLAAAGVSRLGLDLEGLEVVELPPEVMLPAPGQGALAVEARAGDPHTAGLAALHDAPVARRVGAERLLLQMLGGGCHLPFGCLADEDGGALRLTAVLGEVNEEITHARIARVAAAAPTPEAAARACHAALAGSDLRAMVP